MTVKEVISNIHFDDWIISHDQGYVRPGIGFSCEFALFLLLVPYVVLYRSHGSYVKHPNHPYG
jgi:hypothetical protein